MKVHGQQRQPPHLPQNETCEQEVCSQIITQKFHFSQLQKQFFSPANASSGQPLRSSFPSAASLQSRSARLRPFSMHPPPSSLSLSVGGRGWVAGCGRGVASPFSASGTTAFGEDDFGELGKLGLLLKCSQDMDMRKHFLPFGHPLRSKPKSRHIFLVRHLTPRAP